MKVTTFAKLAGGLSERSLPCTAIRKQETRNFLEIFYLKLLPELKGQKFERLLNLTGDTQCILSSFKNSV
jgi:hypothetical protein